MLQQKPCSRNVEIPGGGGSSKSPLERKFLRGGGMQTKNLPWEGYGYFLEPHIQFQHRYFQGIRANANAEGAEQFSIIKLPEGEIFSEILNLYSAVRRVEFPAIFEFKIDLI